MNIQLTPRVYARTAGLLYLCIIIFGLIAQVFVREQLVDFNSASVTAKNIGGAEFFYRFGFVSQLLMLVCDIMVTAILYILFRNASRNAALVSGFFRLVSICILGVAALSHYAAALILKDETLSAFSTEQQNTLSLLSVKLHGPGYNISLFFFGFHLMFLGHLIRRSGLLPYLLGYMLVIAGVCYIANSLIWFLFPSLGDYIYPFILIPCFLSELFLCLWLLFKGIAPAQALPYLQRV